MSDDHRDPPPGYSSPQEYAKERLARIRHSISVLNTSHWQDFSPSDPEGRYLNLTGFREGDGYAWDRLEAWEERCALFSREAWGSRGKEIEGSAGKAQEADVYQNVTGIVKGRWVRYVDDLEGLEAKGGRQLNLSAIAPGIEWTSRNDESWTRHITGKEGALTLKIDEKVVEETDLTAEISTEPEMKAWSQGLVREISATVIIQDQSHSGDGWDMRVHGTHWPRQGSMLLTTTSEKFAGVYGLPHLTLSPGEFLSSQKLHYVTLDKSLTKEMEDVENPWSSSSESSGEALIPSPHCEYVVYAQAHPLNNLPGLFKGAPLDSASLISQIEEELRFPNGAPMTEFPRLQVSTVIFSPDCGFILESKGPPAWSPLDGEHLVGLKQEVYLHRSQSWLLVLAAVIFCQTFLLKLQSKEASTPSALSRVSLYTISMMLLADGLIFSGLSLLSASVPDFFPSALLASFAALMSLALGAKFVGSIYGIQEPERQRARQAAIAATRPTSIPNPGAVITAAGADILPTSTTHPTTTTPLDVPVIVHSDQDVDAEIAENTNADTATLPTATTPTQAPTDRRSEFGAVYGQFVLLLAVILFITLTSTSWPVQIRTLYTYLMSFIYLSFWLPQIRRNIIRNCRKALLWQFIIGQSVLRLLPFAYFLLKEDNIIFAQSDWKAFCVLAGWVWIQIWVLAAQEVLGPRWGIPKGWTEEGWDYHPILSEDNVESGRLPIGLVGPSTSPTLERVRTSDEISASSGQKKHDGVRTVDCAICMQVLEVPVVAAGEEVSGAATGGVAGILARRQYMVTPCRHIFHSACLEGWMKFRLQCPICRENLPPL